MSKQVKERVKKIEEKALTEIPAIMKTVGSRDDKEAFAKYQEARQKLNLLVIKTVLGASIEEKKKSGWNIKYTKKLPTVSELNKICRIMDQYTEDYEVPFYAKFIYVPEKKDQTAQPTAEGADTNASMEIPQEEVTYISNYKKLGVLDNITKKKMKEELFQHNLASEFIDSSAVMVIASYGEKIHKRQKVTTGLIAGGIALVVAGGIITGLVIANNKKHHDEVDGMDPDLENIDVTADENLPDVDAPMVDMG